MAARRSASEYILSTFITYLLVNTEYEHVTNKREFSRMSG
jgi:hypothetical protein